jgi:hypothetical protein
MNTCPNCRGLDDSDASSREVKYARGICTCYECQLCQARGSIQEYMDHMLCDHSFVSQYRPVIEQGE